MDTNSGIGLAYVKPEGYCFMYDGPDLKPWPGYTDEFNKFFSKTYGTKWYFKPVLPILYKACRKSWDQALLTNAKGGK